MNPRRHSPLAGRKPTRTDLARFASPAPDAKDAPDAMDAMDAMDDVLPDPSLEQELRLLIVGINPGLWTAAVNAPFARPGNRFWPSLHRAGLTGRQVDASRGLSTADEQGLTGRGIGITNLVGRATARADELSRSELRAAGAQLIERLEQLRPHTVAIAGITAFRAAYQLPAARIGRQETDQVAGWPQDVQLWVAHQPSGLNAHAGVDSLATAWAEIADASGVQRTNTG